MDPNNNQTPDLATVLANLAALAPGGLQQAQQQPSSAESQIPHTSVSSASNAYSSSVQPSRDPRLWGGYDNDSASTPQHRQRSQVPQRNTPPPIDPATITEWTHGLRCVTKIASHNPQFKLSIQRLIGDQESHIQLWERGKKQLSEDQFARRGNADALKGTIAAKFTGSQPSSETDEAELEAYDKKVYKALRELFNAHSTELKRLGVPFFGMNPELIVPSGSGSSSAEPAAAPRTSKAGNGKITEDELLDLQRRMLQYLEDMYQLASKIGLSRAAKVPSLDRDHQKERGRWA